MVKKRNRPNKPNSAEFDQFVAEGGTIAPPAPSEDTAPAGGPSTSPEPKGANKAPVPGQATAGKKNKTPKSSSKNQWQERAASAKKTEAQPFRYNQAQKRLLDYAKEVEGRDYSKILAEIVWPVLEERYGQDVPIEEA